MFVTSKNNQNNGFLNSNFEEMLNSVPNELMLEYVKHLNMHSKIPFLFTAIPFDLIDEGIYRDLDAVSVNIFSVIARYIDLSDFVWAGNKVLLSGWTIPISQRKIAEKSGFSQRTVQRKIKDLVEESIIEVENNLGKCNRYRLLKYVDGAEHIKRESEDQKAKDNHGNGDNGNGKKEDIELSSPNASIDKTQSFVSDDDNRPNFQNIDASDNGGGNNGNNGNTNFKSSDTQGATHVSGDTDIGTTLLSYVKDIKKILKEIPLSKNNQGKEKKSSKVENRTSSSNNRSLSTQQLIQENPNWEEYRKYATNFYGQIPSKKLLVEACVYFKEKVAEIGFAEDGVDRVMQMIDKVKAAGAYHHTSFDKQFGVEAYNEVLEEEKKRLQKQEEQQQENSNNETDEEPEVKEKVRKKSNLNNQHESEINLILNRATMKGKEPIESAKEFVEKALLYRWNMVQRNIGTQGFYTEEQIEEVWKNAYLKFGFPETPQDWFSDRVDVRENLSKAGLYKPLSEEDLAELKEESYKRFGEEPDEDDLSLNANDGKHEETENEEEDDEIGQKQEQPKDGKEQKPSEESVKERKEETTKTQLHLNFQDESEEHEQPEEVEDKDDTNDEPKEQLTDDDSDIKESLNDTEEASENIKDNQDCEAKKKKTQIKEEEFEETKDSDPDLPVQRTDRGESGTIVKDPDKKDEEPQKMEDKEETSDKSCRVKRRNGKESEKEKQSMDEERNSDMKEPLDDTESTNRKGKREDEGKKHPRGPG